MGKLNPRTQLNLFTITLTECLRYLLTVRHDNRSFVCEDLKIIVGFRFCLFLFLSKMTNQNRLCWGFCQRLSLFFSFSTCVLYNCTVNKIMLPIYDAMSYSSEKFSRNSFWKWLWLVGTAKALYSLFVVPNDRLDC